MKDLKEIAQLFLSIIVSIFIFSCGSNENKKNAEIVFNEGEALVQNGKGKIDTIPYTCIGCEEYLTFNMFETVKKESSEIAKNNLNNPLSFKPVSMDITIFNEDSLVSFDTNQKIENVKSVFTKYKYIGQNAYGTEMSGEQTVSFYMVNEEVKDISSEIKLPELKFEDDTVNRLLSLSNENSFIKIIPTIDKSLIVMSSLSCVDEGTWLLIKLANGEEIKLVSWNKFNCDGTSYFKWFTKQQVELLKAEKIKSISVVDKKSVVVFVPKNETDYFMLLLSLYN